MSEADRNGNSPHPGVKGEFVGKTGPSGWEPDVIYRTICCHNLTEVEGYTDSDYAGNTDNQKHMIRIR